MSNRILQVLWILLTIAVLPLCAGCATTSAADNHSLSGDPYVDGMLIKPGEDPETVSEWTKFQRKASYRTKKMFNMEPNESVAREHFSNGEKLFSEARELSAKNDKTAARKKYEQAAKEFKAAAKRWPDSPLEEDALFMNAESLFFCDRYTGACDAYGEMMKKYENSRYLERAVARQFAIGRYWDEKDRAEHHFAVTPNFTDRTRPLFDTQGNAIKAYESVYLNDPTGPLADDAVMATANAHFLSERYDDADHYYDMLRKQYPQSEHQQVAFQLGLRSKMRSYQGPQYEASPLEGADELVQQISSQFDLPPDEKERVRSARRAVHNQRAHREWETAEYYAKTKHYGAARFHYNSIINDYGDTPFAEQARQRLEKYKDYPDNPPDHFKWINRIFHWNEED
jgi:outer membrane protein assembly factor BamD (BamD/ComL family)